MAGRRGNGNRFDFYLWRSRFRGRAGISDLQIVIRLARRQFGGEHPIEAQGLFRICCADPSGSRANKFHGEASLLIDFFPGGQYFFRSGFFVAYCKDQFFENIWLLVIWQLFHCRQLKPDQLGLGFIQQDGQLRGL